MFCCCNLLLLCCGKFCVPVCEFFIKIFLSAGAIGWVPRVYTRQGPSRSLFSFAQSSSLLRSRVGLICMIFSALPSWNVVTERPVAPLLGAFQAHLFLFSPKRPYLPFQSPWFIFLCHPMSRT